MPTTTRFAVLLGGLAALTFPASAAAAPEGDPPMPQPIHGYTHGSKDLARSPISLDDLEKLKATLLFTEEDAKALRRSREILEPQVDAILDVWYGFVGSQPHLLAYFSSAEGKPDGDYLAKVRARFGRCRIAGMFGASHRGSIGFLARPGQTRGLCASRALVMM